MAGVKRVQRFCSHTISICWLRSSGVIMNDENVQNMMWFTLLFGYCGHGGEARFVATCSICEFLPAVIWLTVCRGLQFARLDVYPHRVCSLNVAVRQPKQRQKLVRRFVGAIQSGTPMANNKCVGSRWAMRDRLHDQRCQCNC